jgi:hypothetical protein
VHLDSDLVLLFAITCASILPIAKVLKRDSFIISFMLQLQLHAAPSAK